MREWRAGRVTVVVSEAVTVRRRTAVVDFPGSEGGRVVQASVIAGMDGQSLHAEQLEVDVADSPWEYVWNLLSAAWTRDVGAQCSSPNWVMATVSIPDLASPSADDYVMFQCARPVGMLLVSSDRLGLPALRVDAGRRLGEHATVLDALNIIYELLTGRQN